MAKLLTIARFCVLSLVNVILTYLFFFPLTFAVVPFARADGTLPRWLLYFATQDASLDAGWRDGYFLNDLGVPYDVNDPPTGFELYRLRCYWLFRNTAYGLDYYLFGIQYDPTQWNVTDLALVNGTIQTMTAWTKDNRYFCYTASNGFKFGWKLWWALDTTTGHLIPLDQYNQHNPLPPYPQEKRLMFVFTP
jgi:hypothetical protein